MNFLARQAKRPVLAIVAALQLVSVPRNATAQQTPSPPPSTTATAPATGGSGPAIESILLQYQGSLESAARIAIELNRVLDLPKSNAKVVIVSNSDISGLIQLRVVLGQAGYISARIEDLDSRIAGASLPCASPPSVPKPERHPTPPKVKAAHTKAAPGAAPRSLVEEALTLPISPSDIQTLLQTIASVGSVNESASPASGTLSTTSLINLVANRLPRSAVVVPSVYPPSLLRDGLEKTRIGAAIHHLETARQNLLQTAGNRLDVSCENKSTAKKIAVLTAEVAAASALVESFEVSLFSGPAAPSGSGTASPSPGAPSPAPSPASPTLGTGGVPLAQLLYADYLYGELTTASPQQPYYFLTLNALESGGNTLTRSTLFGGSRLYYSGGAVSTFSLFADEGKFICSGISYGYRGFIEDKDLGTTALGNVPEPGVDPQRRFGSGDDSHEFLPRVSHFTSSCPNALPSPTPAKPDS